MSFVQSTKIWIAVLWLTYLASHVSGQISYLEHSCYSCYGQDQGRFCLNNGRYDQGSCCHMKYPTFTCETQGSNRFCISRDSIRNGIVGDFGCPANANKCPSNANDIEVKITEMN